MKKYAVIVAGGSGIRMGSALPKQFIPIHNRPLLWYTLRSFLSAYEDLRVLLVLPPAYMEMGARIAGSTGAPGRIECMPGGETRFHSVQQALPHVREQSVVFVHDGVRCLLSTGLIHRCFEAALEFGSAIPCIDSADSVRMLQGTAYLPVERSAIKLVQTPQTFLSDLLLPAYRTTHRDAFTDDATVVEASGHSVHLVAGERNNIKITGPADLELAGKLLNG